MDRQVAVAGGGSVAGALLTLLASAAHRSPVPIAAELCEVLSAPAVLVEFWGLDAKLLGAFIFGLHFFALVDFLLALRALVGALAFLIRRLAVEVRTTTLVSRPVFLPRA